MTGNPRALLPGQSNLKSFWLRAVFECPTGLLCFVLAAITLGIYAPVLSFDFVEFDDDSYVTLNPAVQRGLTFEGVLWAFRGFHVSNWHPVTMLSHMLDCSFYHLSSGGHHFTSLLFHAANTLLLFLLLKRMTAAVWRPAIVAALFAWHPLHVESVAWVAERKDVLSTFFLILTIWAYVRYAEKPELGRYAVVLLWFALGLMSKPMLVTLPCVLLILDYWPLGRMRLRREKAREAAWECADSSALCAPGDLSPGRTACSGQVLSGTGVSSDFDGDKSPAKSGPLRQAQSAASDKSPHSKGWGALLLEKLPFFALSVAASILTLLAQREGNALVSLHSIPFSSRLGNAVIGYAGYLGKTLWPANLCAYYPLGEIPAGLAVCSGLVLLGMSALVWRSRAHRLYLVFGWLWYLVTLLPVIGLVQVSGQAMADRYTYVPLLGVFVMIVWGAAPWVQSGSAPGALKAALVGAVCLACLVATSFQLQYWRNGVRLFARCVDVTSDNFLAHHNLAVALSARGHKEEAVAQYAESLRLYPNNAKGHYSMALDLTDLGRASEAIDHYAEAARLRPRDAGTRINLGVLLAQQGKLSEALEQFLVAVKSEPGNAQAHLNLANALSQQGQTQEALGHYRASIQLAPEWPDALNRFACVLATHRDARFRDGTTAVRLAEAANKLTAQSHPAFLNTLAAAYAEAGRFDEAVAVEQRALQKAIESGQRRLSPQIQNCLNLYQAGKPYHEAQ